MTGIFRPGCTRPMWGDWLAIMASASTRRHAHNVSCGRRFGRSLVVVVIYTHSMDGHAPMGTVSVHPSPRMLARASTAISSKAYSYRTGQGVGPAPHPQEGIMTRIAHHPVRFVRAARLLVALTLLVALVGLAPTATYAATISVACDPAALIAAINQPTARRRPTRSRWPAAAPTR